MIWQLFVPDENLLIFDDKELKLVHDRNVNLTNLLGSVALKAVSIG